MRLLGWPSYSDEGGAILPVETQEIDFHGSALELKKLAEFFSIAAARAAEKNQQAFEQEVDFEDSKNSNTTPICVTVHYGDTKF
ncbi:MAG: hypothetical protein M3R45_04680 [Pseudomonadota bacterium]|nr:hypothetical protein [Pseudomonadota bacterium]